MKSIEGGLLNVLGGNGGGSGGQLAMLMSISLNIVDIFCPSLYECTITAMAYLPVSIELKETTPFEEFKEPATFAPLLGTPALGKGLDGLNPDWYVIFVKGPVRGAAHS